MLKVPFASAVDATILAAVARTGAGVMTARRTTLLIYVAPAASSAGASRVSTVIELSLPAWTFPENWVWITPPKGPAFNRTVDVMV
jgi:hypothetical protein